jgi:hypothetical protein
VTYEPSVIVIPQGRKQVRIGDQTLIYDSSRYLLTSVDLPTVARVVEASEQKPCLAVNLKLDILIVREFLSQEEFHMLDVPPESPAMSLESCGHSVPERTHRTRDHVSNPTRTGRRTVTGNRDVRRSEPPYSQSNCLD